MKILANLIKENAISSQQSGKVKSYYLSDNIIYVDTKDGN